MSDNENMNQLLSELSKRLGVKKSSLENAAKSGNLDGMLKNVDGKQAETIESILSDPQKTKQVLNSPQAQALLKLLGGDKNG